MKRVYLLLCTDIIHEGHINILNKAKGLGYLIVGVLDDTAMIQYNRFPIISLEERVKMVRDLNIADEVIVQHRVKYDEVIDSIKPDVIVHGDAWKNGFESCIRDHVLSLLKKTGGELVEFPNTISERIEIADNRNREKRAMPEFRRKRLKKSMELLPIVRTLEVHNGLTGLIAEKTVISSDNGFDQYDAMWISSLCDSTAKGKPDIELVDMTSRLQTIEDVIEVTTKPIIFDGDTGGLTEHFVYNVRTLERVGVSAVIIEDKTGLKKNSLFGTEVVQTQDTIENFCEKIRAGKKAQRTDDFMIIARCESLILEKGLEDAMNRCLAYVKAGADGIMIHSRKKEPSEIFEFVDAFRKIDDKTPLVVVPSSFNTVKEEEFAKRGVNIVIYANQLIRAAFPAMRETAAEILRNHRAKEVDEKLMKINEIITLIDEL